jgi:hypothetical protein
MQTEKGIVCLLIRSSFLTFAPGSTSLRPLFRQISTDAPKGEDP